MAQNDGTDETGYVVNDDTYLLKFIESRYAGMRIEVQPLDVKSMIQLQSVEISKGIGGDEWYNIAAGYFIRSLVDWNLKRRNRETREVEPIPRTAEGLASVTLPQFLAIYRAWMTALTAPSEDDDLGKDSQLGGPSLQELPMTEPSSESPSS